MNEVFTQKEIAERLDKVDGHRGLAVGVLYNQLRNMLAKGLLPHLESNRSGPSLKSRFAVEYDRVGLARARILTKLTTIGFDTALLKSVQDILPDDELDFVLSGLNNPKSHWHLYIFLVCDKASGEMNLDGGIGPNLKTVEENFLPRLTERHEIQATITLPLHTLFKGLFD